MSDFQPKPFGKFFLIEKLATGGMAEIYKAKTFGVDGFEKLLAIKRILPHCSNDKEFINMLIDEAKLSVLLSHANIAQAYDLGKVGDDYFISMEFVDGINLRELINRCKELKEPIPQDIAVYIASEICKGLDYAHSKRDSNGKPLNIVHRDISPQNILLSYEGEVKIVDFGIAKAALNISHTVAGILKGKITYMSPEQALGKPVDDKTDIFSTALIFYELLTGDKMFTGETQFEVLKKIRSTRITESKFQDSIPDSLKKILAKGLAYSSKDRFQNAGDMQIELTKCLYSTYIDFSPRKLANLVKRLFSRELQGRIQQRQEVAIDAHTRSILLDAERQQNIVHREENEKTSIDQVMQHTQTFMHAGPGDEKTVAALPMSPRGERSYPYSGSVGPAPTKKPKWTYLLVVALLITTSYFLYTKFIKNPVQGGKRGTIQITSVPPGAKVLLNDSETAFITPATLEGIDLNISQKITLKKEKHKEWTRLVTLISTQPLQVEATLDSIPTGTVSVTSQPPGAKIFLDGKELGILTPNQIPDLELNKSVTIRLEKEDHRPFEEKINVSSVEPIRFDKKLEEIKYGSAEVKSFPPGAKIFLNNQDTQTVTPSKLTKLEIGRSYSIRLSLDQYRDVWRTIQISGENQILISEKLLSEEQIRKKEEDERKRREEEEKKREERIKKQEQIQKQQQNSNNTNEQNNPIKTDKTDKTDKHDKTDKNPKTQENPTSGSSYVSLSAPGAEVFINGERKGTGGGRFEVPAGRPIEIVVTKGSSGKVSKIVTLRPGETRSLGTIDLGTEFGSVRVESTPDGASVYLNGKSTGGKTPLVVKGIRRGKDYNISVELSGYERWERSFSMDEDRKSFSATLKKK